CPTRSRRSSIPASPRRLQTSSKAACRPSSPALRDRPRVRVTAAPPLNKPSRSSARSSGPPSLSY
ncbi:hypothetical protein HK405_000451, partial [Cladochytrium tenue]